MFGSARWYGVRIHGEKSEGREKNLRCWVGDVEDRKIGM